MSDSFAKRQRERKKMQKKREKQARKQERVENPGEAPAEGATWFDLVGEEGGARVWDAGAAAEGGEEVADVKARLEAEAKAAEQAREWLRADAQRQIDERRREKS